MVDIITQCEEDLKVLNDLKAAAIMLTSKNKEKTCMYAKSNTVPYKIIISYLNNISVKLDMLYHPINLSEKGVFMLDMGLKTTNLGSITYKGIVSDLFHRWIGVLNEHIYYITCTMQNCEDTKTAKQNNTSTDTQKKERHTSQVTPDPIAISNRLPLTELKVTSVDAGFDLGKYAKGDVPVDYLKEKYEKNMNKILTVLEKGSLVYGTPEFENIMLYISNIYELIKHFSFEAPLLTMGEFNILKHVRICICHDLYEDETCLVDICTAIGILITLTNRLKENKL